MTCEQCKYHSYIDNTHFCDSRNHKRKTVRISQEDAEKDIECYWADKVESEVKHGRHTFPGWLPQYEGEWVTDKKEEEDD